MTGNGPFTMELTGEPTSRGSFCGALCNGLGASQMFLDAGLRRGATRCGSEEVQPSASDGEKRVAGFDPLRCVERSPQDAHPEAWTVAAVVQNHRTPW